MRLLLPASVLALGLSGARLAAAVPGAAGVEVDVAEACTRVDRAQLERLLNIEQRRDAGQDVEQARVSVKCEGELVTLRVEERGDGALPRSRSFVTSDVTGEVGARVLALAAIELLGPHPAPAQPEPKPATAPEPERGAVTAPPPLVVPAPSVRLMALFAMRSFRAQHPLAGGGLSVDYLRLGKLGLRLDFDVAIDERRYEAGSAHLQLMTFSAQAGYFVLRDSWSAHAFAGYRFGSGRITGESASSVSVPVGTVAGACGGPLLAAGVGSRFGMWTVDLGAEAGLVSFPLEGQIAGHDAIALSRYWLGFGLSVGALL